MKTKVFALAVGLAWLSVSQVAVAQGSQDPDSAKAASRFQQAVELYREGSFEGALAEFRKAYQLSPSYRVLYNIAQTQYALHDFVGAYKSLTQYVNEGRGEIPADRRVQVDDMSAKLSERIAQLHIATNVEGAEIRVDDVTVGTSPLSELVPVNVGARRVTVHRAGSPVAARVVTVAGKEKLRVDITVDEPMPADPTIKLAPRPAVTTGTNPDLTVGAKARVKSPPSHLGLIVSVATTGALAIGTGVFGYLALTAQADFKDQLNKYPNTAANIEDARSKSKQFAHITDGFGAATLLSAGVAVYFLITDYPGSPKNTVALSPSLGGMVLHGSF